MTLIYGQVFDPLGRPVGEASVYVVSAPVRMPDIAQLTDGQGKFIFSAPVPGLYILGVRSDSWGATQKRFEISSDEELVIEVRFP